LIAGAGEPMFSKVPSARLETAASKTAAIRLTIGPNCNLWIFFTVIRFSEGFAPCHRGACSCHRQPTLVFCKPIPGDGKQRNKRNSAQMGNGIRVHGYVGMSHEV
jgi:hypothetical protein